MRGFKAIAHALIAVWIISVLASCGAQEDTDDLIGLKIMLFGNKPNGMEEVLAEFERQTADTLGVRLDIEWSPLADHKERLRLRMTAGEEYDLVFDAPFMNLKTFAPQGVYMALEDYFNNDKYQGLKRAFPPEYVEYNKILGHLYSIPFSLEYGLASSGVFLRKDLREKYGLEEIKNLEQLQIFFDTMQEKEPDLVTFAVEGRRGFLELFNQYNEGLEAANMITFRLYGFTVLMLLSEDQKQIVHTATIGDPEENFAKFPAPFNSMDKIYGEYNKIVEWNKYLEKDSINQKDPQALFYSGAAAAVEASMDQYINIANKTVANFPEAQVEFYPSYKWVRELTPNSQKTTYLANNFLCIPKTSKKVDKSIEFINWIFESQENHDLFELGIKGKHWEPVGDKEYRIPDSADKVVNYNFPGYELTWNPLMSRTYADLPANIKAINEYSRRDDTFYKDILAGFQFDVENLKSEVAKVSPVYPTIEPPIRNGIEKNPRQVFEEANQKARALGYDILLEQLCNQLNEFLANR